MSKGSKRRKEDTNKYRDAWEIIWGEKRKESKDAKNEKTNQREIKSTDSV